MDTVSVIANDLFVVIWKSVFNTSTPLIWGWGNTPRWIEQAAKFVPISLFYLGCQKIKYLQSKSYSQVTGWLLPKYQKQIDALWTFMKNYAKIRVWLFGTMWKHTLTKNSCDTGANKVTDQGHPVKDLHFQRLL